MSYRYKTDYAGAFPGYCVSREGALKAASKHLIEDGYSRCTIIDLERDKEVAWVSISADRKTISIKTAAQMKDMR